MLRKSTVPVASPRAQPVSAPPRTVEPVEAQIAQLFRDLRRLKQQSIPNIAAIFHTHVDAIQALEQGDVARLPPWPETVRLVSAYTASAGIDAGPVLDLMRYRLEQLVQLHKPAVARSEPPAVIAKIRTTSTRMSDWVGAASSRAGSAMLAARTSAPIEALRRLRRPSGRLMVALVGLLLVVGTVSSATMLQASVSGLPRPVSGLLRGIRDFVVWQMAPIREGHRWIEVDDPRSRRGDKLHSPRT